MVFFLNPQFRIEEHGRDPWPSYLVNENIDPPAS